MGIMNTATEWKRESSAEEKKHTQQKLRKRKAPESVIGFE